MLIFVLGFGWFNDHKWRDEMKKEEISELQLELRKSEVREQVSGIKTQVGSLGLSLEDVFESLGEKKPATSSEQVSEPAPLLYFLRTCAKDGSSYKGSFQWDLRIGAVNTAKDWDPAPECGKGLHGLLAGTGNANLLDWGEDAVWVVFSSPSSVDLEGKHKVQHATVCAVGERKTAIDFLLSLGFQGVHGCYMTGGYGATMTGGDGANMTGGDSAMLVFKYWDSRRRNVTVYVGENGILPNVAYKLNEKHQVVKA